MLMPTIRFCLHVGHWHIVSPSPRMCWASLHHTTPSCSLQMRCATQALTRLSFSPSSAAAAPNGAWPLALPSGSAAALAKLRTLSLSDTKPDYGCLKLLPGLQELQLRYSHKRTGYGPSASLAGISQLTRLRQLGVTQYFASAAALAEICQLSNLTSLDLSKSYMEALPAQISALSALQDLDLCRCRLSDLPAEICHLSGLRSLDLSYNAGLELPATATALSALTQLLLDWTSTEVLEHVLGALQQQVQQQRRQQGQQGQPPGGDGQQLVLWPQLQRLSLRSNALPELPAALCRVLPALQHLDLGLNQIERLPREAALLQNLRSLVLRINELDDDGLPLELAALTGLTRLDVSGNTGLTLLPWWASSVESVDVRWSGCDPRLADA